MKIDHAQRPEDRRPHSTLILICGISAAGIGFVALLGWLAGLPVLSSFGPGRIPMAPSTAFLILLYGLGVLLPVRPTSSRTVFWTSMAIGAVGTMAALLLFILSSLGIHSEAEHFGIRIVETIQGAQLGHISPVTAFCLVLVGLSFLASLSSSNGQGKSNFVTFWSSVLVVLSSLVLLLAYILRSPLLYGSSVIPPALPTSLALLLLGTARLANSRRGIWPHGSLPDRADVRSAYALLMIYLFLVVGIVIAGYLYLRNYEKKYRAGVEQQLSSITQLKVSSLEQYRKERLGDASLIFKNDQFSDMVRRFMSNPDDAAGRRPVQSWLKKVQAHFEYDQMRLLDVRGVTLLSEPAGLRSVSAVTAKRIADVLRTREVAFLDFHLNDHDHRPYLTILIPVLDTAGDHRAIGVVTLRIDPETYLYPFINFWPSPSRTAETLLIRREGGDALFLNDLRFRKNRALSLRIPLERKEAVAVQAALGRQGIVEGVDEAGVPVVADAHAVPDSPWVLIACINVEEIYRPLRQQLWTIIALVGALLAGAGAGVVLLWRQQHVRFYREQYEVAEELRKSEERFRQISENTKEWIWEVDREGLFTYASRVVEEILGYKPEELVGKMHFFDVYPSDTREQIKKEVFEYFAAKKPFVKYVNPNVHKNGGLVLMETSAVPILDGNGDLLGYRGIKVDITEYKKLEAQLRHAQKMEAVGTLAGGVAHDFNNILNVILGYGNLVMDSLAADGPSRGNMREVLNAAERAAELTKRLLVFSRKQVVAVRPVDINELIRGLQKMLARIISENIEFTVDLADGPLIVQADAGQLEQVLMNLATNAKDAMPEGGRLTIITRIEKMDDVSVALYGYGKPGTYALIRVADTGRGIDKETQRKIFEPFFTTKGIGEGTGLGLAISYGIIKQHSGYIKVFSEPGHGASFDISLPLSEEAIVSDSKMDADDLIKGGTETILVAEDDDALIKLTRIMLEAFGYRVISAKDGEDAILKFRESKEPISLVLLDMIMPKMNGKEVGEAIRKASPGTKILFASGYTMDQIKPDELTSSGFDFIHKPFIPKDLLKKVREVLDR